MRFTFDEIKTTLKVMENIPTDNSVDLALFFSNIFSSIKIDSIKRSACTEEAEKELIKSSGISVKCKEVDEVVYVLKDGTEGRLSSKLPLSLLSEEELLSEIIAEITPYYQYYGAILDKITESTGISEVEIG